ncbi:hypothetical protein AK812_SmicGene12375 [Symbiodinium microadriaticum]|uniref:Uncharacterized protein n=1 Tax=Symbiodinium microadriaticum TaxID=2951 RepID=A0A1Q9EAS3_SYMMI|nr:hypothetical protein AK812_SmicGene12375 [Symbiodinium microadriaticum]
MGVLNSEEQEKRRDALLQLRYAEESLTSETCQEVLDAAQKAMILYRELGDEQSAADAVKAVIAAVAVREGEDKALSSAKMHMENYQRTGDKCGEATMKLALANVYLEANRLQIDGAAILAPVTTDANDDGAEIVENVTRDDVYAK